MKRQEGYYWVKFNDRWIIAQWYLDSWDMFADEFPHQDDYFEQIGERIETPEESKNRITQA